jgi:hypothetical protein
MIIWGCDDEKLSRSEKILLNKIEKYCEDNNFNQLQAEIFDYLMKPSQRKHDYDYYCKSLRHIIQSNDLSAALQNTYDVGISTILRDFRLFMHNFKNLKNNAGVKQIKKYDIDALQKKGVK